MGIAWLVYEESSLLVGLVQAETGLGFYAARSALRVAGTILLILGAAFVALQAWLILILADAYAYIRRRELAAKLAVHLAAKEALSGGIPLLADSQPLQPTPRLDATLDQPPRSYPQPQPPTANGGRDSGYGTCLGPSTSTSGEGLALLSAQRALDSQELRLSFYSQV